MPFYLYRVIVDDRIVGFVKAPTDNLAWAEASKKYNYPRNMTVQLD